MPRNVFFILIAILAVIVGGYALFADHGAPAQADEHGHAHEDTAHNEHGDETTIAEDVAVSMGITVTTAGPATIRETIQLSGRMALNQNQSAQVKARFAGIVRSVKKDVGDTVKRGETLATVESNESLQVYAVPSPLSGTVLARSVSVGDMAGDAPIYSVADLSSLWVEFYVFAADMGAVQSGQNILVYTLDGKQSTTGSISAIQPAAEASSQSIIARGVIDNADNRWRPGMTVRVDAVTHETEVALAVPTSAIQRMEGNTVVFVRENGTDHYRAVPVTLGRSDSAMSEVTEGLVGGETVVGEGSFIVKADIAKAGASHDH